MTEKDAEKAMAEAEAMQVLVSDLGSAITDAGITNMKALEDLMVQTIVIATAADRMAEAVADANEYGAQDARIAYLTGMRDSRPPLETVLRQLADAGVDTDHLAQAAQD